MEGHTTTSGAIVNISTGQTSGAAQGVTTPHIQVENHNHVRGVEQSTSQAGELVIDSNVRHNLVATGEAGVIMVQNSSDGGGGDMTMPTSVRVSNELGAARPKAAKFSVLVTVSASVLVGILFMAIILASRSDFPKMFTDRTLVIEETSKLGYLLAATILLNSIQPVLNGVAVGAGWQSLVAFVNIGCYYLFGLPISILLGYKFKFGVQGIWSGILGGCLLQTVLLLFITIRTNWQKEALQAEEHVRTWDGPSEPEPAKIVP
ncbi:hypothetical protein IFM89_030540 [Coptis chinensis]|uniref:Protein DETOXIFICATION n=1 Tax=Coptis chinensis TaxID=261450 RepID=A0A835HQU8_9MAGN|nr:hypothetical protein IFM89_030540 [Coptis chinensis]